VAKTKHTAKVKRQLLVLTEAKLTQYMYFSVQFWLFHLWLYLGRIWPHPLSWHNTMSQHLARQRNIPSRCMLHFRQESRRLKLI